MGFRVLALDYDGTIARAGVVSEATRSALEGAHRQGLRLVLVTGRERRELEKVCDALGLFEWVVAENGGTCFRPGMTEELLASPVPAGLESALRGSEVWPLSVGKVVIATLSTHARRVETVLRDLRLTRELIRNKESLMILPAGVDKAMGLAIVLGRMGLDWAAAMGCGDAENDLVFLRRCGMSVAVGNALAEVKQVTDHVMLGSDGEGVAEFLEMLRNSGGPSEASSHVERSGRLG